MVCPSSLVHNWLAEAGKFVPDLEVVAIEGPKRKEVLAAHPEADLLVPSYALLRVDIDLYRDREFKVVILDEAQHIKNPEAQVSRAAFRLQGRHRFALTGTPMENSVNDLWSIMNFVMPGYLGERSRFADRFEKPLARGDAPGLQRRLSRRLKPVVLRRLKEEVALEGSTIHAARALGMEKRSGSLEAGKDADIVIWTGDPLDPRQSVGLTMVNGKIAYDTSKEPQRF